MSRKDRVRNPKYAYNYEVYDWRKQKGICVNCGKERACIGSILCPDCWEKYNLRNRKYYKNHKEECKKNNSANGKKLYWYRRENGLCTKCGKKAVANKSLCISCLTKKRLTKDPRWNNDIDRSERPAFGLCYVCGKPLKSHEKLCDECYEKASKKMFELNKNPTEAMIRNREQQKREVDAFWRRLKGE